MIFDSWIYTDAVVSSFLHSAIGCTWIRSPRNHWTVNPTFNEPLFTATKPQLIQSDNLLTIVMQTRNHHFGSCLAVYQRKELCRNAFGSAPLGIGMSQCAYYYWILPKKKCHWYYGKEWLNETIFKRVRKAKLVVKVIVHISKKS